MPLILLLLGPGPVTADTYYDLNMDGAALRAEHLGEDGKQFRLRTEGGAALPRLILGPGGRDKVLALGSHPTPSGATRDRAELQITSAIRFDRPYALGMRVMRRPGGWVSAGKWHLIMQCHQAGTQLSPPLSLNLEPGGRFSLVVRNDADRYEQLWSGPMPVGRWTDLVVEFTMGQRGRVRLWVNGRRVLDTRAVLRWQGGQNRCTLKTGMYRGPAQTPFEMWFDDIRLGDRYRDVVR